MQALQRGSANGMQAFETSLADGSASLQVLGHAGSAGGAPSSTLHIGGALAALPVHWWRRLLRTLRGLLHSCLSCVRLLTSSDDPNQEAEQWATADGVGVAGLSTHRKGSNGLAGRPGQEATKGILVDQGYYEHRTAAAGDSGLGPAPDVVAIIHLMQVHGRRVGGGRCPRPPGMWGV